MIKTILPATILLTVLAQNAYAGPIDTFKEVCLNNAGNTAAIREAINAQGFEIKNYKNGAFVGFRKSTDESVQVNVFTKHAFECAVTTSDIKQPRKIKKQFFKELGLKPSFGKASGSLGGKSYTFVHNTKGGEAFIMYLK